MKKKNKILTLISSVFGVVAICGIFACSFAGSRKNTSVSALDSIQITTNDDFNNLSVDSFLLYGTNHQKHSYSSSTMIDSSFVVGYDYYVYYNYRSYDFNTNTYEYANYITINLNSIRYQYNGVNYVNFVYGTSSYVFDLVSGSLPDVWIFEVESITLTEGSSLVDVTFYMRLGTYYNDSFTKSCNIQINAPVSSTFTYSYGIYDYVSLTNTFNYNLSENTTSYNVGFIDGANATYQSAFDAGYNSGYDSGYMVGYSNGYTNGAFVGNEQGYNEGYKEGNDYGSSLGYSNGYEVGYSDGSTNGFDTGYAEGVDSQIPVIQNAYSTGYGDGYAEAYNGDQTALTIFSGILQIAFVPINFFLSIFNFEILGVNLSAFIRALFTVAITIIVVKLVMGGTSKGE